MDYTFDTTSKAQSSFISEDYFPAIIEFSSEELNNHFIEYNFKDTDMLELSVHPKTHALKRLTLTLCNHYKFVNELMNYPSCDEGSFFITGPDSIECNTFMLKVYNNGAKLELSDQPAVKHLKSGILIFSFSTDNELVSIYISDLDKKQLSHIKRELTS